MFLEISLFVYLLTNSWLPLTFTPPLELDCCCMVTSSIIGRVFSQIEAMTAAKVHASLIYLNYITVQRLYRRKTHQKMPNRARLDLPTTFKRFFLRFYPPYRPGKNNLQMKCRFMMRSFVVFSSTACVLYRIDK